MIVAILTWTVLILVFNLTFHLTKGKNLVEKSIKICYYFNGDEVRYK